LRLVMWVYIHSNFAGGFRKTHLFCKSSYQPFKLQGHPRSLILIQIESAYAMRLSVSPS